MSEITPFLWFDDQAEQAAQFYVSIFGPRSKIGAVTHYGDYGGKPKGSVMTVSFELDGRRFIALNGGPQFTFNESLSLVVNCESQAEIDHFWEKLSADGDREVECGWLKDKFGVSWQIVPAVFWEWTESNDKAAFERVMNRAAGNAEARSREAGARLGRKVATPKQPTLLPQEVTRRTFTALALVPPQRGSNVRQPFLPADPRPPKVLARGFEPLLPSRLWDSTSFRARPSQDLPRRSDFQAPLRFPGFA